MALTDSWTAASVGTALLRGRSRGLRCTCGIGACTHAGTRIFGRVLTGGCRVCDDLRSVFQLLLPVGNDLFALAEARGEDDEITFREVDLDRLSDDWIRGLAGDVRRGVRTGGLTLVRTAVRAAGGIGGTGSGVDRVIRIDGVDEGTGGAGLDGCSGDDDGVRTILGDETDVHKLIGEELVFVIIEDG